MLINYISLSYLYRTNSWTTTLGGGKKPKTLYISPSPATTTNYIPMYYNVETLIMTTVTLPHYQHFRYWHKDKWTSPMQFFFNIHIRHKVTECQVQFFFFPSKINNVYSCCPICFQVQYSIDITIRYTRNMHSPMPILAFSFSVNSTYQLNPIFQPSIFQHPKPILAQNTTHI